VDSTFKGCTTPVGDIIVANYYSGSFVLGGITNLTGSLDASAEGSYNDT
jgi:hypothetical protein